MSSTSDYAISISSPRHGDLSLVVEEESTWEDPGRLRALRALACAQASLLQTSPRSLGALFGVCRAWRVSLEARDAVWCALARSHRGDEASSAASGAGHGGPQGVGQRATP